MCPQPITKDNNLITSTKVVTEAREVPSDLIDGLNSSPKCLPCALLYDNHGSALYEKITELEEYYPYKTEQRLLQANATAIISNIKPGSIVVELGCGDGSKTSIILNALIDRDGPENVHFLGIDVSAGALSQAHRNLNRLCPNLPDSQLEFIAQEYLPGLTTACNMHPEADLFVLWLGSSVGNFAPPDAASFLAAMRAATANRLSLLLCCDLWKDAATLHTAYDDPKGVTREFIINGMHHALSLLQHPDAYASDLWKYEVIINPVGRQVEMWLMSQRDIDNVLPGVDIKAGERVLVEISRKFAPSDIAALAYAGGYCLQGTWASPKYSIQLLLPPHQALKRCWADTDYIYYNLVEDWEAQPIDLRRPFLFYYGHMASFTKLQLLSNRKPPSDPFDIMFSRGIDPNVLDPSQCHAHPEAPPEWPSVKQIEAYVQQIRCQVLEAINAKDGSNEGIDMHAMSMTLEHERMHCETLCYMLAQDRKARFLKSSNTSANGTHSSSTTTTTTDVPSFFASACYADTSVQQQHDDVAPQFVQLPGGQVTLGLPLTEPRGFNWDNELGTCGPLTVAPLKVAALPVTVAEYRDFILQGGYSNRALWEEHDLKPADDGSESSVFVSTGQAFPSTWSLASSTTENEQGDFYIHLPEASYHWTQVKHCPVYLSLAEARAYAKSKNCRIMTEAEYEQILNLQAEPGSSKAAAGVVAMESGGWEWTNTEFQPFEGFAADPYYLDYSTDFFDGLHFVMKGSCSYTHPGNVRRLFRNYYQHLYPNMFAKFRLVADIDN